MSIVQHRSSGLVVRAVGNELLLLDTELNRIHQLNETAGLIWRSCNGCCSAEDIAQRLVEQFDVEWDKALEDVLATVSKLSVLQLVVPAADERPDSCAWLPTGEGR